MARPVLLVVLVVVGHVARLVERLRRLAQCGQVARLVGSRCAWRRRRRIAMRDGGQRRRRDVRRTWSGGVRRVRRRRVLALRRRGRVMCVVLRRRSLVAGRPSCGVRARSGGFHDESRIEPCGQGIERDYLAAGGGRSGRGRPGIRREQRGYVCGGLGAVSLRSVLEQSCGMSKLSRPMSCGLWTCDDRSLLAGY